MPDAARWTCVARALLRQQLQAEQEEEYITNKLMKRLEALKHEKEELARQVEVEEEMITNALTKKLQKVKEEKVCHRPTDAGAWRLRVARADGPRLALLCAQVHLENQLEQEQEYNVNKLQKQLSTVLEEKLNLRRSDLERSLLPPLRPPWARAAIFKTCAALGMPVAAGDSGSAGAATDAPPTRSITVRL